MIICNFGGIPVEDIAYGAFVNMIDEQLILNFIYYVFVGKVDNFIVYRQIQRY